MTKTEFMRKMRGLLGELDDNGMSESVAAELLALAEDLYYMRVHDTFEETNDDE